MAHIFTNASNITFCAAALMLACVSSTEADTSEDILSTTRGEGWGTATNQLCAGVDWFPVDEGRTAYQVVKIAIKSSKTNATLDYLVRPDDKLAKVELRDETGVLLVPLKGKKLDGDLPQQLTAKDWPREPERPRHAGGALQGRLVLDPHVLAVHWEFVVQDIYRIEKEGDYTFAVRVALYHFTYDKKSLVRMDLPSVTVHMHLTPSHK